MSGDPYPQMEPFPFADLFWCHWLEGDVTPSGGTYRVACRGCGVEVWLGTVPALRPPMTHRTPCPVADYIDDPSGGTEARARLHQRLTTSGF